MNYFTEPHSDTKNKMEVELDLKQNLSQETQR